jgi:hypothetical protein
MLVTNTLNYAVNVRAARISAGKMAIKVYARRRIGLFDRSDHAIFSREMSGFQCLSYRFALFIMFAGIDSQFNRSFLE